MKNYIYSIGVTFLLLSVLQAGIVSAGIEIAPTSDFDNVNGKKFIFYGDVINSTTIWWRDFDNHSNFESMTEYNLSQSVYHFTIDATDLWGATYIEWGAMIKNSVGTYYEFAGGFSTVLLDYIQQDLTNYSEIKAMFNNLTEWYAGETFQGYFINMKTGIITTMEQKLSDYNEGLIANMQTVGLTASQIEAIFKAVDNGFNSTLSSKRDQGIAVANAEIRGRNNAWQLVGIFLAIIFVVYVIVRLRTSGFELFNWQSLKRRRKSIETELNLDVFDIEEL